MTADLPSSFRVLSFGDVDGSLWGTAVDTGELAFAYSLPGDDAATAEGSAVSLTEDGPSWKLSGDGIDLLVSPVEEPVGESSPSDGGGSAAGSDNGGSAADHGNELCQVTGTLSTGGIEHTVECPGVRSRGGGLDLRGLDSLRWVAAWFEPDRGLGLLASRPGRSKGQESDRIAATVFESEAWLSVEEPRLSTTYRDDGAPARASLELWIGDGDEQYPRRAAAEAAGARTAFAAGGFQVEATPLRCHTAGLDGAGLYLIARF